MTESRTLQFESPRALQSLYANDIKLLKHLEDSLGVKVTTREGWMKLEGDPSRVDKAKVSVHVYDSDGKLAEEPDSWEKGHFAAAHVIPKTTGSYFIIVSVEQSPEERTHWALVYGFR